VDFEEYASYVFDDFRIDRKQRRRFTPSADDHRLALLSLPNADPDSETVRYLANAFAAHRAGLSKDEWIETLPLSAFHGWGFEHGPIFDFLFGLLPWEKQPATPHTTPHTTTYTTADEIIPHLRRLMRDGVYFSTPRRIAAMLPLPKPPHVNTIIKALESDDDLHEWCHDWLLKHRHHKSATVEAPDAATDNWTCGDEAAEAFEAAREAGRDAEAEKLYDTSTPLGERQKLAKRLLGGKR